MNVWIQTVLAIILFYATCVRSGARYERVEYFDLERPKVVYYSKKYFAFVNMSSHRYSRQDPVHYFNLEFHSLVTLDNNFYLWFSVYEFLSNEYRPSFVELHAKVCNFFNKDPILGDMFKASFEKMGVVSCPFPPGKYNLHNMSRYTAVIPNFPFRKGRLFLNVTDLRTKPPELITAGHIDLEIKVMKIKKP